MYDFAHSWVSFLILPVLLVCGMAAAGGYRCRSTFGRRVRETGCIV
jgi:hypothetical protein